MPTDRRQPTADSSETPDYLRGVEPLPPEALQLVDEAEERELLPREEWWLSLEVLAACRRVRSARIERDGRD